MKNTDITRGTENSGLSKADTAVMSFPWEAELTSPTVENDAWLISFIDILILLLTLLVLLLVYQKHNNDLRDVATQTAQSTIGLKQSQLVTTAKAQPMQEEAIHTQDNLKSENSTLKPQTQLTAPASTPEKIISLTESHAAITTNLPTQDILFKQETPAPNVLDLPPATLPPLRVNTPSVTDLSTATLVRAEPVKTRSDRVRKNTPDLVADPIDKFLETLGNSKLHETVEVNVLTSGVNLEINESILFKPASASLTESGKSLLEELYQSLKTQPYPLSIEGHTDNVPIKTAQYQSNWELSSARATVVTRYLIKLGIPPDRVRAIGYADTHPRADNQTPEGRAKNRRVSFLLQIPSQAENENSLNQVESG